MVALRGLVELRKARRVLAPVELARVNDYTGDGGAMTADPFGGGMDNNVSAYSPWSVVLGEEDGTMSYHARKGG